MNNELNSKPPLDKKLIIYWSLAIISILGGGFWVVKKISKKNPDESTSIITPINRIKIPPDVLKSHPLSFTKLRERGFYEEIVLPGKVSFDLERMANVGSRVPGRVNKVYVKEGDMISNGSPLAVISSIELGTAQADYLKSRARLEVLKSQLDRANDLFEQKIISTKEFEMTNVEFRTVKTEMETSLNSLLVYGLSQNEITELEKGKLAPSMLTLRSPIAGTVTERKAVNGQSVSTEENLFIVANLTRLWIILDVYEKDLYSVKLDVEANVFTLGDRPETVKARVAHVSEIIDPVKHTAEIRLEVDNRDFKLKPGQTVSAKVQGLISESKSKRIMVVPSDSIHKIEGKSFVFIAHTDGTFEAKSVEVGESIDDDIEIKSGISTEDNIVSQGSFLLKSEYLK
ncbi:MAG: efflux RND transporter periplasmic adaptor subunit [Spirochaetia bacterium]|nr:efflux RND transporter periplasmic adaptor subunit [Spirochaetia bacterium]